MEHDFWHNKWQSGQIGFHLPEANPLLINNFSALGLNNGDRVFVPLCGKTIDIHWLLNEGYSIVGAELNQLAIEQLFDELEINPTIQESGELLHYSAPYIDVFVGDIFELTGGQLGKVDAVYDRAAFVALPSDLRKKYSEHLVSMTNKAPQLLVCFEYDQNLIPGPPFSTPKETVYENYAQHYTTRMVAQVSVDGGLKGKVAADELVWLLRP